MAWVKIDDGFAEHPKLLKAGPLAMAMQLAALCYCNRNLTDGFVPRQAAARLLDLSGIGMRMWDNAMFGGGEDANWQLVVEDLVEAGVWREVQGGWQVHDYLEYQPSKADVLAEREKTKQRVNKWRERNAVTNGVSNANCNAVSNAAPVPVPVPDPVNIKKEKEEAHEAVRAEILPPESKPDPRKAIFDDGLRWLSASTNKPSDKLRPLMARWIKARGDPEVAAAIIAAQQAGPVEPISWIEARLKSNERARPSDLQRRRARAEGFLSVGIGGDGENPPPPGETIDGVSERAS